MKGYGPRPLKPGHAGPHTDPANQLDLFLCSWLVFRPAIPRLGWRLAGWIKSFSLEPVRPDLPCQFGAIGQRFECAPLSHCGLAGTREKPRGPTLATIGSTPVRSRWGGFLNMRSDHSKRGGLGSEF